MNTGRDGPYRALAARDAARILATGMTVGHHLTHIPLSGDFACPGDCDRVDDLGPEDFEALERWRTLYAKVRDWCASNTTANTVGRSTQWSAC